MGFLRRIRFSLRTLLMFVLLAGSTGLLTSRKTEWSCDSRTGTTSYVLALSSDGLALAGEEGSVLHIWRNISGAYQRISLAHKAQIYSIAFSLDGRRVAAGDEDGHVRVWGMDTGNLLLDVAHPNRVEQGPGCSDKSVGLVAFLPDSKHILSTRRQEPTRIWSIDSGNCMRTMGEVELGRVIYSPDATLALTFGPDGTARMWDADFTSFMMLRQTGYGQSFSGAAWTDDGPAFLSRCFPDRLIIASDNRTWFVDDGADKTRYACISPNARYLVTSSANGSTQVRDLKRANVFVLPGTYERVYSGQFSADSQHLAIATNTGIHLWSCSPSGTWWGVAWLPEFWLAVVLTVAFGWSVRQDRMTL